VRLYFEQGIRLADPAGLLENSGRKTRRLTFASLAQVVEKAAVVSLLVREAAALRPALYRRGRYRPLSGDQHR
jgi:hypothetical protein